MFCFKQKTAYEMRISDWSSDVCSSDLLINNETYSQLVEQGFRRSGLFTYRPHCDKCQACLPIRVDVTGFNANRSQRKTWKRHSEQIGRASCMERVCKYV